MAVPGYRPRRAAELSGALLCAVLLALSLPAASTTARHIEVNVTVPPYELQQEDSYLCVAKLLPPNPHKLIGVIPRAEQKVTHHILIYGCKEPHKMPQDKDHPAVWRCDMQPVCSGASSTILYGWGRNAPDLRLPEGVGFTVGKQTSIQYVVVQVHYLAKRPPEDHTGVTLVLKPHAVPYAAGVVSYASWFSIPPGQKSHKIRNSCCFKSYQPLNMFAVRVHTHALGRRVYMEREKWDKSGIEELVSRDPQLPQSFVPTARHMIWPGDRLTVTCDFDSTSRTAVTNAGGTHKDEMCNMYVMVYGKTPFMTMCGNDETDISDQSPGAFPRLAKLQPDPAPWWQPPTPQGLQGEPLGPVGDATSVTTGPDGTLWVLYRASARWTEKSFDGKNRITSGPIPEAVVVHLDPDSGTVLSRWGANTFYMPHSITVDNMGNVWVTDVGLHQVLKFDYVGNQLLAVGQKLQPGAGRDHFCKPTQVSVLRDGSFVVSDGYCNSRVVQFTADGKFVAASAAIPQVVHGVLVDECEAKVYVAAREPGRVLVLDMAKGLQLHTTIDLAAAGHGMVWALKFGPYGEQLALAWKEGQNGRLINLQFPEQAHWELPGTEMLSPHDFVLGAAPTEESGVGDRFFAVYLASVGSACDKKCGPLRKFVAVPHGIEIPNAALLKIEHDANKAKQMHPGDAVLLPHGAAVNASHLGSALNITLEEADKAATAAMEKVKEKAKQIAKGGEPDEMDVMEAEKEEMEEEAKDGEVDQGGAMVADDYDEGLEDDAEDADDYEEQKEEEERMKEEEDQALEDYIEEVTGVKLNIPKPAKEPEPVLRDRYEVISKDKKVVEQQTRITSMQLFVIVGGIAIAGYAIGMFSTAVVKRYLEGNDRLRGGHVEGMMGGPAAQVAGRSGGPGRSGPGGAWGGWSGAGELMSRFKVPGWGTGSSGSAAAAGGSDGGSRYAKEVEAARERERLLRSGNV